MSTVDTATGEVITPCTADEARDITERMRSHRDDLWRLAVESHDRRAWAALGYSSWRDYIEAEVGVKSSQAYRLLDHGRTMLALAPVATLDSPMGESVDSPIGESPLPTHESQTRPMARLPEDQRADAWTEAVEEAAAEGRTPTARDVEEAVERRLPKTTRTVRTTRTRQTITESPTGADGVSEGEGDPEPSDAPERDDAAAINAGFERHVDPAADYRLHVTTRIGKALDLKMLDIEKAIATAGDSAEGHRLSIESIREWCNDYLEAARPHLRRVK